MGLIMVFSDDVSTFDFVEERLSKCTIECGKKETEAVLKSRRISVCCESLSSREKELSVEDA